MAQTETTARCALPGVELERDDPAVRLGEWLVRRDLINRRDLFQALHLSYVREMRLGDALVALGVLQRLRVESEAQALGAARLPDGRVRSQTPPPLPAAALSELRPPGDTAVKIAVPPAPVHDLDGPLPDSEELLCLSGPPAFEVQLPLAPVREREAAPEREVTLPEAAPPGREATVPYATEQPGVRPLAPLYLELDEDWD